ncbi:MAG: hypothetical protein LBQ50_05750 [Planctomycetaceae bacterium]|jgi:hypothetical protein|nr:hypothetical protein [Planctomycetaceae bacterium]
MDVKKILDEQGIDINIGQYVVFDDDNSFLAQTDTVDEAFRIADTHHVKCPALVNLDEFRNLDYVF